jgi:HSP20 family protein
MVLRDLDYLFNSLFYTWPQQEKPPISREMVYDKEVLTGVRLQLALAGYSKDDIKVKLSSGTLKIIGDNLRNSEINEKFRSSFEKTITISKDLDLNKASVKFENGILEVFVPVAEREEKWIFLLGK